MWRYRSWVLDRGASMDNGPIPGFLSTSRSRRDLLRATGAVALGAALGGPLAGCASEEEGGTAGATGNPNEAPKETFTEPSKKLSGDLKILLWSHFVPSHDTWFDKFAKDWG